MNGRRSRRVARTLGAAVNAALGAVLERHPHVWIFADDMYEHIVYDGADSPIEFAEAIYPPGRFTAEQRYELS